MGSSTGDGPKRIAVLPASWVYAFGPFRLDPMRGLLRYGSEIVPLPDRLMAILLVLVRANGSIVARSDLRDLIRSEGEIDDNNLSQHIYLLRRALGERKNDRLYIDTVHTKGFRFIAPISVVTLPDAEKGAAIRSAASNVSAATLEVFRHHSAGCQLLMRGGAANLSAAAEHFSRALRNNEAYVPALIGSARAFLSLARNSYLPGSHAYPKARDTIIQALRLDPVSAAAHGILSNIILCADWNWGKAKREIDSAVLINPENAAVRISLMWLYEWIGKPKKALFEAQSAIGIEPSLPALQVVVGRLLIASERYEDAIAHLSNLIENDPEYVTRARHYRAQAYLAAGGAQEALSDLLLSPHDHAEDMAWRLPLLGQAYAAVGDVEKAEQVYASLLTAAKTEHVAFGNLIPLAMALNRRTEALRHLELATVRREAALPLVRHLHVFDELRETDAYKRFIDAIHSATADG